MRGGPTLLADRGNRRADAVRRVLDVLVAGFGLACSLPLMGVIAATTYLDSGWPVLFVQTRLGQGGRRFRLFKFRKFSATASPAGAAVTLLNDPRLTRTGRFLERTKLDELPQLWNVFKGDMSIVGPRPETPNFSDCFAAECRRILDFKPGIFGPSQAIFRNEAALYAPAGDPERFYRDVLFPTKARVDLSYYPSRTVLSDMMWVVRGILAVLGYSPVPRGNPDFVQGVDAWIRQQTG